MLFPCSGLVAVAREYLRSRRSHSQMLRSTQHIFLRRVVRFPGRALPTDVSSCLGCRGIAHSVGRDRWDASRCTLDAVQCVAV